MSVVGVNVAILIPVLYECRSFFCSFRPMDIRPNHTLYVNNLNEKVKKIDLRRALYYLFCQYGRIIDIITMKTMKMRGQAFIIYQELPSATTALRALQGFSLFQRVCDLQRFPTCLCRVTTPAVSDHLCFVTHPPHSPSGLSTRRKSPCRWSA